MNTALDISHENEPYMTTCETVESPFSLEAGVRYRFEFPNGYGASVIKLPGSYGFNDDLWELGLMKDGHLHYNDDFYDVEGNLCDEEVNDLLDIIRDY